MLNSNAPIVLAEGRIVAIDNDTVDAPMRVIQRLTPDPRLIIECENLPDFHYVGRNRCRIMLDNGTAIDVCDALSGLTHMQRWSQSRRISGEFVPIIQPCVVMDAGRPLRSVGFSVLNFQKVFGQQDQYIEADGTVKRVSCILLQGSSWLIKITAIPGLGKELSSGEGYVVTHTGLITRSDGGVFSTEDADVLLSGLRAFLSFARGASCGIINVEGKSQDGKPSWIRGGSQHVEPWPNPRSWLIKVGGGDVLSQVFPRFWQLFKKDTIWRDSISRVIDWYLISNEGPLHSGLILTQAALELLSAQILQRDRGSERTGEFLKAALDKLGLDTNVPTSCQELLQVHNWASGPHAIVEIRNDLVHPKAKYGPISVDVHYQVNNLGQLYIEWMLLHLFGHQGQYWNRLTGELGLVPWSQNKTATV